MSVNCIQRSCGTAPPGHPGGIVRGGPRPFGQDRPGIGRESAGRASFAETRSAALELRTADGDTVSISFETVRRLTGSRGAGGGSVTAESSIAVQVAVTGSLSDQEVDDISNLLRDLVQASAPAGAPSPADYSRSVASYAFASDWTAEAGFARVRQAYS